MAKIILTPQLQQQVDEILAPLYNPKLWKEMKLEFAKNPYAIVRLEGAPGTGKTRLAQYMAHRLQQPPLSIDFAKVASSELGETEKAIHNLFQSADETETKIIIMEECDALLWTRAKVTEDTMHMLGFVNTLLTCIDKFRNRDIPSLLILTSNHPELLDPALESRVTDVIKISPPTGKHAYRMWNDKLPATMNLTHANLEQLASLEATPRQIEAAILKIARKAVKEGRYPRFEDFGI